MAQSLQSGTAMTRSEHEPSEARNEAVAGKSTSASGSQDGPTRERDLEARSPSTKAGAKGDQESGLVTWDSPEDPANPKNWSTREKMTVTVLMSLFTFISPVSSSMASPALGKLGDDLGMKKRIEEEMALSIFLLGYALGPLFFGPVSEVFGRSRVLQFSNFFYLAWNLGCGFAQDKAAFFVMRFLAGIGGSAPLAVGAGVISDCWSAEDRGKAVGIYTLGPMLGPSIGPLCAGFIAERSTWRWVFWSTSITAGVIQLAGLVWMRETYAPVLLKAKRNKLAKETGNDTLRTGFESKMSLTTTLRGALVRPARMIATQPIVQVIALYMAYLFGVTYLVMVSYPVIWTDIYGESLGIGGLNFLSLAVGSVFGILVSFKFVDPIYRGLKERNNGVGRPEFRIPAMFVGSAMVPIGLFWYGWSVQARTHWIMPNIGTVIFTGGTLVCLQGMQGYVIDTYSTFAASANAAAVVLRSLAGFSFPLFASYLYERLGYGWGTSVLAFISIAIGIPAPIMFYLCGEKLRALSTYASG